jgi:hypothetical protein
VTILPATESTTAPGPDQSAPSAHPFAVRNPSLYASIGVGRADSTPSATAPINNWGAAVVSRADRIAHPLTATVLVLSELDRSPSLVWVSLDLGWWRLGHGEARVRTAVAERLGLDRGQVLLSLSHTHAGPAIDPTSAEPTEQGDVLAYLDTLVEVVLSAAGQAVDESTPALLEWGAGSCHLAWNRDQWLAEEDRFVCGFAPDQPADPMLLVGRVSDPPTATAPGRVRAVIVNYACHPTTLGPANSAISGDYVSVARDLIERAVDAPMIFVQGASGELAPRRQYQPGSPAGDDAVQANGQQLGYAVLSTLAGMLPAGQRLSPRATIESGAPLGIWALTPDDPADRAIAVLHRDVPVPRNHVVSHWGEATDLSLAAAAERDRRADLINRLAGAGDYRIPVTACRLGDAVLLAQPGEAYSRLQLDLRSRFADRPVIVANLTGGAHHGYLPPAEVYGGNLYQVWQTPAGVGALELVREACIELVEELLGGGPE